MERIEIKFLFNYLENNLEQLNSLQYDFIITSKKQYRSTGVLTHRQIESLRAIKEHLEKPSFESESEEYHAQYSSFDSSSISYVAI